MNIDAAETARCDLRLDFSRLGESFADGSVAEVAMIHSLSYLRLWEARQLFADLHRLLRPGGRLVLELPDLAKCAERALRSQGRVSRGPEAEGDEEEYLEAVRGLYAFDMGQIERREAFTPYAFGWSAWHLRRELARAGFVDIRVLDPVTHGPRPWRDSRIEATA